MVYLLIYYFMSHHTINKIKRIIDSNISFLKMIPKWVVKWQPRLAVYQLCLKCWRIILFWFHIWVGDSVAKWWFRSNQRRRGENFGSRLFSWRRVWWSLPSLSPFVHHHRLLSLHRLYQTCGYDILRVKMIRQKTLIPFK